MALQLVTVKIDQKGEVNVDTEGFHGKGCDAVHAGFAAAHGGVESSVKKPEFYKPLQEKNKLTQKG